MYLNSKGILSLLALWKRRALWYLYEMVFKGSMMVMKGVCRNNLYYLKGSTVTGQVETSNSSNNGCIKVWR